MKPDDYRLLTANPERPGDAGSQRTLFELEEKPRIQLAPAQLELPDVVAAVAKSVQQIDPIWWQCALAAVKAYAGAHESFLAEDVRKHCPTPERVDERAWGAIMRAAAHAGYVRAAGYAPAKSSNRSPKVLWRSLLRGAP